MKPIPITPQEWRRVLMFALMLIGLTMLPYLAGWLAQTDRHVFSGAVLGTEDFYSYIGKMRLGARGIWDFYLFYTPEPSDAVALVFLPYILPGQVVGRFISSDSPALFPALVATYHLMRIAFDLLLIGVLYQFIAEFLNSPRQRMTALILATLGGGFGWLLTFVNNNWLGSLPPEFFIPEGFSFVLLLSLPHLALARAALLGGLLLLFRAIEPNQPRWIVYTLGASICWWLVGLAVPFYLAVIYCILGAWGLTLWLRRRAFPWTLALRGGLVASLTLPLFAYYTVAFSRNEIFAAWSAQNLLPSPHPLQYLVAYSIFIVLGFLAVRWAWRRGIRQPRYALLLAWVAIVPILVYLPINVQRRTAEAVIVPLAILAAHGLARLLRRLRPRRRARIRNAVLMLASLSSLVLLLTLSLGASGGSPPTHIPTDELAAYDWLNQHAPADAVALSAKLTGNQLPAYTNLRPYVGHGPETLRADEKEALVQRFFSDQLDEDERSALYASVNIRYIFYGPTEQTLDSPNPEQPQWATDLELLYDADGYRIYGVP
ncbi:MAG: hypothetical protein IT320_15390 [Anaerolineae bacterium]|nr:hypothetical protein [Anaerolineae bacterium]